MAEMTPAEQDPPAEGESRVTKKTDDDMCEAYVVLGRLSHLKACHGETAETMVQSLADAGAGNAVELAMTKVRFKYETLKENLEKLYRASMADLHKHRVAMEAPTRARVELVVGQQKAVIDAEKELKALMANPDEEVSKRELPQTLRRANKTLKSSIKLIGLRLPQVKPVTAADFPPGRLDNVTIAPKRSGQRQFVQAQPSSRAGGVRKRSPSTKQPPITLQKTGEEDEDEEQARRPLTPLCPPSPSSFSDDGDLPLSSQSQSQPQSLAAAAAEAVAPRDETAAAAVVTGAAAAGAAAAAEAEVQEAGEARGAAKAKCCRNGRPNRAPASWDEERGEESENAGGAPHGAAKEACGRCACACRADDVWAAYGALRKRYQALKNQADKEEVRIRVEEQRREAQSELDRQKLEMQEEHAQKKLELEAEFEAKEKEAHADSNRVNGAEEPAAPAPAPATATEGVLALSKAEMESLREIVSASVEESQALQQESAELRQQVALGEERLQEALNETLSLREEITKRKQHGEVLLARIRFLKGQTSAYVNNTDKGAGDQGRAGMGTAAALRHESDYRRDSAIDSNVHRSRANGGARQPKPAAGRQRHRPLDSLNNDDGDYDDYDDNDALGYPAFPRSPSEVKDGSLRHPAFPSSPSETSGRTNGGSQTLPGGPSTSRGGDNSWTERARRPMPGPWTGWNGDGGRGRENEDARARRLEREREHLTREVYRLSAQLEVSGVTSTSSRLGPSDLDKDLRSRSFATSASVAASAPAPPAGRSRRNEAAAAATRAEEAAAVAVAAAEKFSTPTAAVPRKDRRRRGRRGYGVGDSGDVGNGRNYRENSVPLRPRRRSSATAISVPDASVADSDCDSTSSSTITRRRSESPSQRSTLAADMLCSPPQQQRQWRHKDAAEANARRMPRRPTENAGLWGRGPGDSDSDTASDEDLCTFSDESESSKSSPYSGSMW